MIKCVHCGGNADVLGAVVVSIDGDFACSPACRDAWKKEMHRVCTEILPDDQKFADWMGVDKSLIINGAD
jgi:hypothetical protein